MLPDTESQRDSRRSAENDREGPIRSRARPRVSPNRLGDRRPLGPIDPSGSPRGLDWIPLHGRRDRRFLDGLDANTLKREREPGLPPTRERHLLGLRVVSRGADGEGDSPLGKNEVRQRQPPHRLPIRHDLGARRLAVDCDAHEV